MARITTQQIAGNFFKVSHRTIEGWIGKGFVVGYQNGRDVLVDIDEIERELKTNKRMRDGRRQRYGASARIVPLSEIDETITALPLQAETVRTEGVD